jgi:ribonuclease HII
VRKHQRLLVGVDEAGRGSLLGPLVVGAFAMAGEEAEIDRTLTDLGVKDSKALSPERREDIYHKLKRIGRASTALAAPKLIDRYVSHGGLNQLELELMAKLVVRVRAEVAYVDACDTNEARFGRNLANHISLGGLKAKVLARHKADRDLPIVGAASIVAKVTRDRALRRLAATTRLEIGSGYPSDPVTRACVQALLAKGEKPDWVRHSWKTLDTLKRNPCIRTLEAFA